MGAFKQFVRSTFRELGYDIRPFYGQIEGDGFVQYRYLKPDGSFDYEQYRRMQEEGNKRKLDWVAVKEGNIKFLADYIRQHVPAPKFGICHGTRRGKEQEWFRKYLGCEVIGTEISETATQFPHTIQWDFHEVKPEWRDAVDFIYSNSFDHTYDPDKCLNAWMSCLKPGGLCLLEYAGAQSQRAANMLDPFGADLPIMPYLVLQWGKGKYAVTDIILSPATEGEPRGTHFLVLRRF
jgi:hypothetical protein